MDDFDFLAYYEKEYTEDIEKFLRGFCHEGLQTQVLNDGKWHAWICSHEEVADSREEAVRKLAEHTIAKARGGWEGC